MNKKFLSAILFGALMVTSTGTFVSCKDYDDDIDNLNSRVDAVESQIKDLQSKIEAGKWITGVTPSASGLTVTLSDGNSYTVTNGTNGTNGTEWTITEDGYWACNGEKTDVKAVGEKGEQGEAGQQEVKYEDGVWKLWNGTEFVELEVEGTSAKTPYCYTDPTDPNYTILVVYTETGVETKLRLPMNEGLAQITILGSDFTSEGEDIEIGYAVRKGTTEWTGNKELPAVGEYVVSTTAEALYVQVTPSNYDLSALQLKLVNGKGEEAPIEVGTPVPYTFSRATSASGVYMVPITVKSIKGNEAIIKSYDEDGARVSLFANSSVRSTYSSTLKMSEQQASTLAQFYTIKASKSNSSDKAVAGYDVDVVPASSNEDYALYIYDSYLELEGSEANLANALKWGISFDGMTVKSNSSADGTLKLTAHYVDVLGKVYKQEDLIIAYNKPATAVEEVDYGAVAHTIAFQSNPSTLVNLDNYFKDMSANDRILWNDAYKLTVGNVSYSYVDKDDNSYQTGTVTSTTGFVTISNNESDSGDLSSADELKKLQNLKLVFDYSKVASVNTKDEAKTGVDLFKQNVEYSLAVNVVRKSNDNTVQIINIPFTINQPSAEAVAAQYAFNSAYNAEKNAFVVKGTIATLANLITVSSTGRDNSVKVVLTGAKKPQNASSDYTVSKGVVTLTNTDKYGTAYAVEGASISYKSHSFAIPAFNVIFEESAQNTYTFALSADLSIVNGGNNLQIKVGDIVTGEDATELDKNSDAALNFYDAAGNKLKGCTVTEVELSDETYVTADITTTTGAIILKAIDNPEVDTKVSATITFKDANEGSHTTTAKIIVTVKAI